VDRRERGKDSVPIRTWIVYPERKDKAGVVVVIHESSV
jgi:dienelactone hydrolase